MRDKEFTMDEFKKELDDAITDYNKQIHEVYDIMD